MWRSWRFLSCSAASTFGWNSTAHLVGREVGVAAGAVPVAADGLGVQRGADAEVLADAVEQPAGKPQLVTDLRRRQRADLELPLAGHDLGVDAGDCEAGRDAGVEVGLDDRAAEDFVGADAAVVATLGGREAAVGEAEGAGAARRRCTPAPGRTSTRRPLPCRRSPLQRARVLVGWGVMSMSRTSQRTSLLSPPRNRVRADVDRLEHAVRTLARRLVGRRAVETPDRRLLAVLHHLGLGAKLCCRDRAVNPDVFGLVWHRCPPTLMCVESIACRGCLILLYPAGSSGARA